MEDKYRYMFLKYVFEKYNFSELEAKLVAGGIKPNLEINLDYPQISRYFSLMNNVDLSRLSEEQKRIYERYFSLSINELCNDGLKEKIFSFLEATYKLVLFPNVESNSFYYGPMSYDYIAPTESVVLGLNYKEFGIDDVNFDEVHDSQYALLCDMANFIQEEVGPKLGINIAVILYNEYVQLDNINFRNK